MIASELAQYLGRTGLWTTTAGASTLKVAVVVKDAKKAYGRLDLQIVPRLGAGEAWVSASSVELDRETAPKAIDRPKPRS